MMDLHKKRKTKDFGSSPSNGSSPSRSLPSKEFTNSIMGDARSTFNDDPARNQTTKAPAKRGRPPKSVVIARKKKLEEMEVSPPLAVAEAGDFDQRTSLGKRKHSSPSPGRSTPVAVHSSKAPRTLRSREKLPTFEQKKVEFKCPQCKKTFPSNTSVNRHVRWCKPKKPKTESKAKQKRTSVDGDGQQSPGTPVAKRGRPPKVRIASEDQQNSEAQAHEEVTQLYFPISNASNNHSTSELNNSSTDINITFASGINSNILDSGPTNQLPETKEDQPVKCTRCKNTYRNSQSYNKHINNCSYYSSSSGDEEGEEEAQDAGDDVRNVNEPLQNFRLKENQTGTAYVPVPVRTSTSSDSSSTEDSDTEDEAQETTHLGLGKSIAATSEVQCHGDMSVEICDNREIANYPKCELAFSGMSQVCDSVSPMILNVEQNNELIITSGDTAAENLQISSPAKPHPDIFHKLDQKIPNETESVPISDLHHRSHVPQPEPQIPFNQHGVSFMADTNVQKQDILLSSKPNDYHHIENQDFVPRQNGPEHHLQQILSQFQNHQDFTIQVKGNNAQFPQDQPSVIVPPQTAVTPTTSSSKPFPEILNQYPGNGQPIQPMLNMSAQESSENSGHYQPDTAVDVQSRHSQIIYPSPQQQQFQTITLQDPRGQLVTIQIPINFQASQNTYSPVLQHHESGGQSNSLSQAPEHTVQRYEQLPIPMQQQAAAAIQSQAQQNVAFQKQLELQRQEMVGGESNLLRTQSVNAIDNSYATVKAPALHPQQTFELTQSASVAHNQNDIQEHRRTGMQQHVEMEHFIRQQQAHHQAAFQLHQQHRHQIPAPQQQHHITAQQQYQLASQHQHHFTAQQQYQLAAQQQYQADAEKQYQAVIQQQRRAELQQHQIQLQQHPAEIQNQRQVELQQQHQVAIQQQPRLALQQHEDQLALQQHRQTELQQQRQAELQQQQQAEAQQQQHAELQQQQQLAVQQQRQPERQQQQQLAVQQKRQTEVQQQQQLSVQQQRQTEVQQQQQLAIQQQRQEEVQQQQQLAIQQQQQLELQQQQQRAIQQQQQLELQQQQQIAIQQQRQAMHEQSTFDPHRRVEIAQQRLVESHRHTQYQLEQHQQLIPNQNGVGQQYSPHRQDIDRSGNNVTYMVVQQGNTLSTIPINGTESPVSVLPGSDLHHQHTGISQSIPGFPLLSNGLNQIAQNETPSYLPDPSNQPTIQCTANSNSQDSAVPNINNAAASTSPARPCPCPDCHQRLCSGAVEKPKMNQISRKYSKQLGYSCWDQLQTNPSPTAGTTKRIKSLKVRSEIASIGSERQGQGLRLYRSMTCPGPLPRLLPATVVTTAPVSTAAPVLNSIPGSGVATTTTTTSLFSPLSTSCPVLDKIPMPNSNIAVVHPLQKMSDQILQMESSFSASPIPAQPNSILIPENWVHPSDISAANNSAKLAQQLAEIQATLPDRSGTVPSASTSGYSQGVEIEQDRSLIASSPLPLTTHSGNVVPAQQQVASHPTPAPQSSRENTILLELNNATPNESTHAVASAEVKTQKIKVILKSQERADSYSFLNYSETGNLAPGRIMRSLRIKGKITSGEKAGSTTEVVVVPDVQLDTISDPDSTENPELNRTIIEDENDAGPMGPTGKHATSRKNMRLIHRAVIVYRVRVNDTVVFSSKDVHSVWGYIFETVQGRTINKLPPLAYPATQISLPENSRDPVASFKKLGLTHIITQAVQFLLDELPGKNKSAEPRTFKFQEPEPQKSEVVADNSSVTPESENLDESSSARCAGYEGRKPFDMFGWLASKNRKSLVLAKKKNSFETARNTELPLAMKFRNLSKYGNDHLIVFCSSIHGRGLFTTKDIDCGDIVIEYAGEIVRSVVCDRREKLYEARGKGCYMFRIDDDYVVDATLKGNSARFINHSCEPNCHTKVMEISGKKHIVIIAICRIRSGEELTYDYKFAYEDEKIPCTCGSTKCRKFLN